MRPNGWARVAPSGMSDDVLYRSAGEIGQLAQLLAQLPLLILVILSGGERPSSNGNITHG